MGRKWNISAVYIPYIEEWLFYLCIIHKVCIVWPCCKLGWDGITRFGKWLKNRNGSGISKAEPKQSFSCGLSSCLRCYRGFPARNAGSWSPNIISRSLGVVQKAEEQHQLAWSVVVVFVFFFFIFFPCPQSQVKHFLHQNHPLRYRISLALQESSIRTCPGQSRGDRVPLQEALISRLLVLLGVKRLCRSRSDPRAARRYRWWGWIHAYLNKDVPVRERGCPPNYLLRHGKGEYCSGSREQRLGLQKPESCWPRRLELAPLRVS